MDRDPRMWHQQQQQQQVGGVGPAGNQWANHGGYAAPRAPPWMHHQAFAHQDFGGWPRGPPPPMLPGHQGYPVAASGMGHPGHHPAMMAAAAAAAAAAGMGPQQGGGYPPLPSPIHHNQQQLQRMSTHYPPPLPDHRMQQEVDASSVYGGHPASNSTMLLQNAIEPPAWGANASSYRMMTPMPKKGKNNSRYAGSGSFSPILNSTSLSSINNTNTNSSGGQTNPEAVPDNENNLINNVDNNENNSNHQNHDKNNNNNSNDVNNHDGGHLLLNENVILRVVNSDNDHNNNQSCDEKDREEIGPEQCEICLETRDDDDETPVRFYQTKDLKEKHVKKHKKHMPAEKSVDEIYRECFPKEKSPADQMSRAHVEDVVMEDVQQNDDIEISGFRKDHQPFTLPKKEVRVSTATNSGSEENQINPSCKGAGAIVSEMDVAKRRSTSFNDHDPKSETKSGRRRKHPRNQSQTNHHSTAAGDPSYRNDDSSSGNNISTNLKSPRMGSTSTSNNSPSTSGKLEGMSFSEKMFTDEDSTLYSSSDTKLGSSSSDSVMVRKPLLASSVGNRILESVQRQLDSGSHRALRDRKEESMIADEVNYQSPRFNQHMMEDLDGSNRNHNNNNNLMLTDSTQNEPPTRLIGYNIILQRRKREGFNIMPCQYPGCGSKISHSQNKHILIHFRKPVFECQYCGAKMSTPSHHFNKKHDKMLISHWRFTDYRSQFEDTLMDLFFQSFPALRDHDFLIHGRKFPRPKRFNQALTTVLKEAAGGEIPCRADQCLQTIRFRTPGEMETHLLEVHCAQKPIFECYRCSYNGPMIINHTVMEHKADLKFEDHRERFESDLIQLVEENFGMVKTAKRSIDTAAGGGEEGEGKENNIGDDQAGDATYDIFPKIVEDPPNSLMSLPAAINSNVEKKIAKRKTGGEDDDGAMHEVSPMPRIFTSYGYILARKQRKNEVVPCQKCSVVIKGGSFSSHIQTHYSKPLYACLHCGARLKDATHHVSRAHPDAVSGNKKRQVIKDKDFADLRANHEEALLVLTFECYPQLLDIGFLLGVAGPERLLIHLSTLYSDFGVTCRECGRNPESLAEMESHMYTHSDLPLFACHTCSFEGGDFVNHSMSVHQETTFKFDDNRGQHIDALLELANRCYSITTTVVSSSSSSGGGGDPAVPVPLSAESHHQDHQQQLPAPSLQSPGGVNLADSDPQKPTESAEASFPRPLETADEDDQHVLVAETAAEQIDSPEAESAVYKTSSKSSDPLNKSDPAVESTVEQPPTHHDEIMENGNETAEEATKTEVTCLVISCKTRGRLPGSDAHMARTSQTHFVRLDKNRKGKKSSKMLHGRGMECDEAGRLQECEEAGRLPNANNPICDHRKGITVFRGFISTIEKRSKTGELEVPYTCRVAGCSTVLRSNFGNHVNAHYSKPTARCQHCNTRFKVNCSNSHMSKRHPDVTNPKVGIDWVDQRAEHANELIKTLVRIYPMLIETEFLLGVPSPPKIKSLLTEICSNNGLERCGFSGCEHPSLSGMSVSSVEFHIINHSTDALFSCHQCAFEGASIVFHTFKDHSGHMKTYDLKFDDHREEHMDSLLQLTRLVTGTATGTTKPNGVSLSSLPAGPQSAAAVSSMELEKGSSTTGNTETETNAGSSDRPPNPTQISPSSNKKNNGETNQSSAGENDTSILVTKYKPSNLPSSTSSSPQSIVVKSEIVDDDQEAYGGGNNNNPTKTTSSFSSAVSVYPPPSPVTRSGEEIVDIKPIIGQVFANSSENKSPVLFTAYCNLLRRHASNDYPFEACKFPGCSSKVSRGHNFNNHPLTHLKKPTWQCGYCGMRSKSAASTHTNQKHPGQKPNVIDLRMDIEPDMLEAIYFCYPQSLDSKFIFQPSQNVRRFEDMLGQISGASSMGSVRTCAVCRDKVIANSSYALQIHVLRHLEQQAAAGGGGKQAFECYQCAFVGTDIFSHFAHNHRNVHFRGDESIFSDHRSSFEPELMDQLRKCFPFSYDTSNALLSNLTAFPGSSTNKSQTGTDTLSTQLKKEIDDQGRIQSGNRVMGVKGFKIGGWKFRSILSQLTMAESLTPGDTWTCMFRNCQRILRKYRPDNHILMHLNRMAFECSLCGMRSKNAIHRKHIVDKHGPQFGLDVIIDKREEYDEDLSRIGKVCFPVLDTIQLWYPGSADLAFAQVISKFVASQPPPGTRSSSIPCGFPGCQETFRAQTDGNGRFSELDIHEHILGVHWPGPPLYHCYSCSYQGNGFAPHYAQSHGTSYTKSTTLCDDLRKQYDSELVPLANKCLSL